MENIEVKFAIKKNAEKIAKELLSIPEGYKKEIYLVNSNAVFDCIAFSKLLKEDEQTNDARKIGKIVHIKPNPNYCVFCSDCKKWHKVFEGKINHESDMYEELIELISEDLIVNTFRNRWVTYFFNTKK